MSARSERLAADACNLYHDTKIRNHSKRIDWVAEIAKDWAGSQKEAILEAIDSLEKAIKRHDGVEFDDIRTRYWFQGGIKLLSLVLDVREKVLS